MSFWNETLRTARTPKRCDECSTQITKGEKYVYGAGINVAGEFGVWKSHPDCLACNRELTKLADLYWDEYLHISDEIFSMDGPGLAWLATEFPGVFERFRESLAKYDKAPEFYVWELRYTEPSRPYKWN